MFPKHACSFSLVYKYLEDFQIDLNKLTLTLTFKLGIENEQTCPSLVPKFATNLDMPLFACI